VFLVSPLTSLLRSREFILMAPFNPSTPGKARHNSGTSPFRDYESLRGREPVANSRTLYAYTTAWMHRARARLSFNAPRGTRCNAYARGIARGLTFSRAIQPVSPRPGSFFTLPRHGSSLPFSPRRAPSPCFSPLPTFPFPFLRSTYNARR